MWNEEWDSFERSVRAREAYHVLISVDESSYTPRWKFAWSERDLSMGDPPVVWWRCVQRGRTFFSALGNQRSSYLAKKDQKLLEGAVAWALRLEGSGCGD